MNADTRPFGHDAEFRGLFAEEAQGLRALYVALTRATKLLSVVHVGELPDVLAHPVTPADRPATEANRRDRPAGRLHGPPVRSARRSPDDPPVALLPAHRT